MVAAQFRFRLSPSTGNEATFATAARAEGMGQSTKQTTGKSGDPVKLGMYGMAVLAGDAPRLVLVRPNVRVNRATAAGRLGPD
jgi:hypothetical protein